MHHTVARPGARGRRTLALGAGVLAAVLGSPAFAAAAPTATLSPTTAYDAGARQLAAGPGTARVYTVRSTGSDPLAIASVRLTGADPAEFAITADSCSARGAANPLAPNATCTVAVAFAPTLSGAGARTATLEIATDGGPTLTSAAISGSGRNLEASASTLAFGAARVGGAPVERTVTLTNRDANAFTLGAVTLAGGGASQFAKVADTCSAAALAQDTSCSITLAFAPTTPGVKAATVAIAGFGPAPVTLSATGTQPAAALAPARRDFGVLPAGTTSEPQTFTLRNSGNGPLAVGAVTRAGADAERFSVTADSCSNTTVAAGATCTVAVVFAPERSGWRTASLRFPTDLDGTNAATVARLSGRGAGLGADSDPFATAFDLAEQPLLRLDGDGGDGVANIASGACDLDGDDYDDVLAGAPLWSRTPVTNSWEGGAYVRFGGPAIGSGDLALHGDGEVLLIEGEQPSSQTGTGIACAGDVNGDGIDDLAIGAWAYEYGDGRPSGTGGARGVAYVVFGARDLRDQSPLDLGHLGERGFRVTGPDLPEYDHLGYAVAGLGDLDGDGRGELAVMANTGDTTDATPARSNNGIVWVLRGQASATTVDLSTPGAALLRVDGASPGSSASPFGQMIGLDGIGDFDGDGTPDLAIGTYTAVAFGRSTASGASFVISGAARGRIDLADASSWLTAVGGAFAGHRLGIDVAAAGDVNGDGKADLAIGADSTSAANSDAAYVVYGRAGAHADLLDAAALGGAGYRVLGAPGSSTGFSLAGVGDADGDGRDDLLVGAYGASAAGRAWLIPGIADPETLPLTGADAGLIPANAADTTRTYVIEPTATVDRLDGQQAGDRFGRVVAGIGDIDGNGAPDLAVGADFALRRERANAGEVTVALLPAAAPAYTPDPDPEQPGRPTDPGTPVDPGAPAPPVTPIDPGTGGGTTPTPPGGSGARPSTPGTATGARSLRVGSAALRVPRGVIRASRTGAVALGTARCARAGASRCRLAVTVTVKAGGKQWRVTTTRTVRGSAVRLTVSLPRAARAALKRTAKGSLVARVVSRDEDGRRGSGKWRAALVGAR